MLFNSSGKVHLTKSSSTRGNKRERDRVLEAGFLLFLCPHIFHSLHTSKFRGLYILLLKNSLCWIYQLSELQKTMSQK